MATRVNITLGRRLVPASSTGCRTVLAAAPLTPPSGSGKTTVLNLLGGLTRPSRGKVWIAGREISDLPDRELAKVRLSRIGFVFQSYNLLPVLTAEENAEFTMLLQGVPARERRERVRRLFVEIGLEGLEDRMPPKLSGGQQQRVAVARAVLADEPTANLDSTMAEALLDVMEKLNREKGTTLRVFDARSEGDGAGGEVDSVGGWAGGGVGGRSGRAAACTGAPCWPSSSRPARRAP